jgi:plastocyanin
MPESVKISELPVMSSVQPNDILPVVDAAVTQTGRATAAQIAAIGGGPPGDNTVSTAKIVNGAVTAPKVGFSATDKIVGRASAGAGNGEEIPCTAYARGLLATADATAAQLYLNALQSTNNPTFTGQVKFADGTAESPSITNTGNTNTGIFFPLQNSVGVALEGQEFVRFLSDGTTLSRTYTTTNPSFLIPQFSVRAWVVIDGTVGNTAVINNQHLIAARYGLPGQSLWYESTTVAKITAMELAYGNTITATGTVAYDGRSNYTSPGDNVHYYWTGSAWAATPASSKSWIGSITIRSNATNTVKFAGNVTSVTGSTTGLWNINFATVMPDTNYCVLLASRRMSAWDRSGDQPLTKTTTYCSVQHIENGVVADTNDLHVAIIR